MRPFWVTFYKREAGCIIAENIDKAALEASKHGAVERVQSLPYPASPMVEGTHDSVITCSDPWRCAGWTSCRRPLACSE